jgi:hypothetical protein
MACPYFDPVLPSRDGSAMLPLGDWWEGVCRAMPDAPQPCEGTLLRLCNMGYARGECPRFPGGDGPDAVRFTVKGSGSGAVRLYYVVERNHHPFAHGPLAYSIASGALSAPPANQVLDRQARAYAQCFLRRSGGI